MHNILIIQLTRLGDMLQTTPLLGALKAREPDCRITLMLTPELLRAADGNAHVDEVIVFRNQELLDILLKDNGRDLLEAYGKLRDMIDSLRAKHFDTVLNLTHNPFSAMLCRLLRCPNTGGFTLSDDWTRVIKGKWFNYFFNLVLNRGYNEFNMVDIYRKFGGSDIPPYARLDFRVQDSARQYIRELLTKNGVSEHNLVVTLQPGASEPEKMWPAASFGRLGDLLVRRLGAKVVVLGTKAEAALGQEIRGVMAEPMIDTCGQTDFGQAAALLERSNLLVTNDTGIMHLACAVGTKVVEISLSKVYYKETGPYGQGHVVVQARMDCAPCRIGYKCSHYRCKEAVTPEAVLRGVEMALTPDDKLPHQIPETAELKDVDILVSQFASDGLLDYVPLIRRPLTVEQALSRAYRSMWVEFLDGASDSNYFSEFAGWFDPPQAAEFRQAMDSAAEAFRELKGLVQQGEQETERMLALMDEGKVPARILQSRVKYLSALDDQIRVAGRTYSCLQPLASFFSFEKENLEGNDVRRLAEDTLQLYHATRARAELMKKRVEEINDMQGSAWS